MWVWMKGDDDCIFAFKLLAKQIWHEEIRPKMKIFDEPFNCWMTITGNIGHKQCPNLEKTFKLEILLANLIQALV